MKLLRTIAFQEQLIAADGIVSIDLPVNPLSVILINLKPLNDNAGTPVTGPIRYLGACDAINRATVTHRGASIFSMTGGDAACLNYLRHGILPREANPDDTDNERKSFVLPILLGRFAYDPTSCFPASRRGELVLDLDLDIADTSYDGLRLLVETIEIIDAKPREFERKTAINRTFAATGMNEIELPLGNLVRGLQLFGTTDFTGAAPAPSWGRVSCRLDNQPVGIVDADWETLIADNSLMGRMPPALDLHTHRVDATAASAIQETGGPIEQGMGGWNQRVFIDFDPTRDDTFSIETKGAFSFQVRAEAETADAVRVVTIEKINAAGV